MRIKKVKKQTALSQIFRERQSAVLRMLHLEGPSSQVDVCKKLSLPKTTVNSIVQILLKKGFIVPSASASNAERIVPGAYPEPYMLNAPQITAAGVCVRNGQLQCGIVNCAGECRSVQKETFRPQDIGKLPEIVHEYISKYCKTIHILGLGLSIGGYNAVTKSTSSLSAFGSFPLYQRLREAVALPVIIEDYPHACALSQHIFGPCKKSENFVYLSLESATAVCYAHGALLRGVHGFAGEIAGMTALASKIEAFPAMHYVHSITCNERTESNVFKKNFDFLAYLCIQLLTTYDPDTLILNGIPPALETLTRTRVFEEINYRLDSRNLGLQYSLEFADTSGEKHILSGAAPVFENIFYRPRRVFQETELQN